MRKSILTPVTKRSLIIVGVIIGLLCIALVIGSQLPTQGQSAKLPAHTLTSLAGPYTLHTSISPNPPPVNLPVSLTISVTNTSTGQLITDAGVEIRGTMEAMDMSMGPIFAAPQKNGTYLASIRLSMASAWQVQVTITRSNTAPASVQFAITPGSSL